ncbi:lanthionine synthetase LanC family protein [Mucilaginibacter sp. CAU 1740]|uniref:lanthionine synthetase LanC family protein n=1 Tax=Mucilaginibacter sp. CAU 1740 TaxID=3140365 RepID=UPI00325AD74F
MEQRDLKGTATIAAAVSDDGSNPAITEHGYAVYLIDQGLPYSVNTPFLVTGPPDGFNDWLLHLSLLPQNFDAHIRPVIQFLKSLNLPFAIPTNTKHHIAILNGNAGFRLTGQVITIGVDAAIDLQGIVARLAELTANATGPTMPCAYHLTDIIAVSHGSLTDNGITGKLHTAIFYGSAIADPLIVMLKSKGEHWPFQNFRPLNPYKGSRLLNRQYIPLETLKKEPKGNVIKVIRINHIVNMQWCVLKQGRRYQSFDHYGRDAKDRLAWQYQVHRRLEKSGILPKPIELFELHGDTFFAMEYKESVTLTEKAAQSAEGHAWRAIPVDRKRCMMAYLSEVVRILHLLHAEGIVHRDVTPSNFIVTDAEQVFAIDIELCYDLRSPEPDPPFTLGTPGFMSPAQAAGSPPSFADDIYSFGALMISVMTGILPNRLNQADKDSLADNLKWFIESVTITSLIVTCLDADPALRPTLDDIQHVLELYDTVLMTTQDVPSNVPAISPRLAANLLTEGFKTLSSMSGGAGHSELLTIILFNRYFPRAGDAFTPDAVTTWLDSCHISHLPGYDLKLLASELSRLKDHTALLLRLMSKTEPAVDVPLDDTNSSFSRGLAGRGLKLLALIGQNLFRQEPDELAGIVNRIIRLQAKDGSWTTTATMANAKGYQVTGFSHGVAGITYFLLSYYAKFHSAGSFESITAALDWLKKQRKMEGHQLTWTVSTENNTVDPWLEHGFSGVALAFIKAYEVLGDREYQEIASQVLTYHPEYITSNHCSFGNGLAGLGEVYLEAFRVFGNRIWLERAGAIQGALLNSCYRDKEQCYWLDGTQLEPKPDFWSGNAGILHFLLRITRPDEIHFPNHLIS